MYFLAQVLVALNNLLLRNIKIMTIQFTGEAARIIVMGGMFFWFVIVPVVVAKLLFYFATLDK